jgi:RNA polymerase sigma-70 factor (ECF subfamily)
MFVDAPSQPADIAQSEDDTALIERCQAGDHMAWRALFEAHFDFAWRTARRLGLPEADAEDAVQEAFQVAFERLHTFGWGQFSTWLYRIVANIVSNRLRRHRVREVLAAVLLRPTEDALAPSAEGQVEARLTLRQIEALLRRLPRAKREVFALAEFEGLSHQQIAELTGVKLETVRTRLFYARREFDHLARRLGVKP